MICCYFGSLKNLKGIKYNIIILEFIMKWFYVIMLIKNLVVLFMLNSVFMMINLMIEICMVIVVV